MNCVTVTGGGESGVCVSLCGGWGVRGVEEGQRQKERTVPLENERCWTRRLTVPCNPEEIGTRGTEEGVQGQILLPSSRCCIPAD